MLIINAQIKIPLREIEFRFSRSGGPGGQNVNKVNTKALLVWSLENSRALSLEMKDYVSSRLGRLLNSNGEVVIQSQRYRSQERNVEDCLEKLTHLLELASRRPKKRKKSKVSKSQKEKRLNAKKKHSDKKQQRRSLKY